jgi:hypothetical protein
MIARTLLDWTLGLDGLVLGIPAVVLMVVGGIAGYAGSRELDPWSPAQRRLSRPP